ncbi:hypothetical protein RND71_013485 [Anisodus tanguticus]|uniref:Uncharacterized protein n=1 Tax=Anisodus tanguticus TaxID=243964 RepID=A0AAE1VMT2_9SOLA|nr:hypothetical protein RND71_013485 [Anisodus tanguticus]
MPLPSSRIENLAANLWTVNGDETGNAKGELLCGLSLPPSGESQENAKGELICGLSLPPSYYLPGHDSQPSPSVRKPSENDRIVEEVEEEVVELEFFDTAAVDKLHTHNAYCPNCSSCITKAVLRKVKRERRIVIETGDRGDQTSDLVGCLSCFSVFVRIGILSKFYALLSISSKCRDV